MSVVVQCTACDFGNHEQHDHDWGLKPGLLGGYVCECSGDCAERLAERIARMRQILQAKHAAGGGDSDG